MGKAKTQDFIPCRPVFPPDPLAAALKAIEINPANRPLQATREQIAVVTSKWWQATGVKLTVGFLDSAPANLQKRILLHANAWGRKANVVFVLTATDPQIRIARIKDGLWSHLGTDNLLIPKTEQTMNLEGFTMSTPESEFLRAVRHEFGHVIGCPHEHMRPVLVNRLDRAKTIAWGRTVLGWDEQTVIEQILTPLNESSIMGTPNADQDSSMCYQLPASITKDGKPIRGGVDINATDAEFIGKIYPLAIPPPPPPTEATWWTVKTDSFDGLALKSAAKPTIEPYS